MTIAGSSDTKVSSKQLRAKVHELEIALECALRCPGPASTKSLCSSCRDTIAKLLKQSRPSWTL